MIAQKKNVPLLVDAAQSAGLYELNAEKLNIDFLVFSGHKMFGPMGTGVLYAKESHWSAIHPIEFGGGQVKNVTFEHTTFMEYPHVMEAGTPHVAGVLGLGETIDFIHQLDRPQCLNHIRDLTLTLREGLKKINGLEIIGDPEAFGGIISFHLPSIHPHDVASFLGQKNIAVRAGHHCAQPLLEQLGVPSTVRISLSVYNTLEEVQSFLDGLRELIKFWQ